MRHRDITARSYDTAQVCIHGHVINGQSEDEPEHNQNFCSICGARTITQCPSCSTPIRGRFRRSHVVGWESKPPLHCHECGKPYPWTYEIIKATKEMVDMADNLTNEERSNLKEDIVDIINNAPRAQAAIHRAKALVAKTDIKDALINLLGNIISNTLVKLWRGW